LKLDINYSEISRKDKERSISEQLANDIMEHFTRKKVSKTKNFGTQV